MTIQSFDVPHRGPRTRPVDALDALGKVMYDFRLVRGFTQEEVGERAGMWRGEYRAVERGERDSRYLKLRRLLLALPDVEWPEFGRALHKLDPLEASRDYWSETRIRAKRLRDTPHTHAPIGAIDGLEGLARVVRAFRESLGGVQERFRIQNGFDAPMVRAVERGRRNIGFLMVRRFAIAFGLTWVQFCDALDVVDRLATAREGLGTTL